MSTHRSFLPMLLMVFVISAFVFIKTTPAFSFDTAVSVAMPSGRQGSQIQTGGPALDRELTARVNASRPAPDPDMQRRAVSMSGVKIAVKQNGVYRVSRAELEAAGFPVDSDSSTWRLFTNGNEQAIIVGDGNQYIDFYGQGIDTFETDTRYYYLIKDTVAGKRMISKLLNSIGGNVVSNNYRFSLQKKERLFYISQIQNGQAENYFGRFVVSDFELTERFTLSDLDPQGSDASIRIDIQGYANVPHSIPVSINGISLGVLTGSGMERFSGTFVVPAVLLVEGTNTIVLRATSSTDFSFFDSVTVNFSRRYAADQNRLSFATIAYRRANVTGFISPNIRVFDTTFDGDPQLIVNPQIVPDGGSYTVRMPSNRPAVFYAVEDSGLLHSPSVTVDHPSALASPDNSADMIIISYSSPEFMAGADNWANYRRSPEGGAYNVKIVDVEDIFDEFSYGLHSGDAVRDFLYYAHTHWQTPGPAYVLILGDASNDRRNYEGYGYWDLVPTRNVSLTWEETGSDEALADFDNDGLAEIPIGRVPARSGSEIMAALSKTVAFETPANQSLHRGALFAYLSNPSYPQYEEMSQQFGRQLPRYIPVLFIPGGPSLGKGTLQHPQAGQQNLIDGINIGNYVVNYAGPGSTGTWGGTSFFGTSDVPLLTNARTPSIITALGDYNGYFMPPANDTLGETLVKAPNGGAVANWGATTVTTPDRQSLIGTEFYRLLAAGNISRMGGIIKESKLPIAGSSLGYSWTLLGDPALKVR